MVVISAEWLSFRAFELWYLKQPNIFDANYQLMHNLDKPFSGKAGPKYTRVVTKEVHMKCRAANGCSGRSKVDFIGLSKMQDDVLVKNYLISMARLNG